MSLSKFFLILIFSLVAVEASLARTKALMWYDSAKALRQKPKMTNEESLELYQLEKKGAEALQDYFVDKDKFADLLRDFVVGKTFETKDAMLLMFFKKVGIAKAKEHGFDMKVYDYIKTYPNSIDYTGMYDGGMILIDVEESYEKLKRNPLKGARLIVLGKTLEDVSTLCTAIYADIWQDWTAESCLEEASDRKKIYQSYSDKAFSKIIQKDIKDYFERMNDIEASGKFRKTKAKTIQSARKVLKAKVKK